LAVLLGLCVGSFLNVCIARLPEEQSIVSPPSHCPRCDTRIHWYDNIPLLSYIMLRGRCRSCAEPISIRYPIVEAMTAGLALLIVRSGFTPLETFLYFAIGCAMIVISFIDIDHYIIPDAITLPSILVAPPAALIVGHISVRDSVLGIIVGGGLLWVVAVLYQKIRKQEGMGLGDVKLLAMIGGLLGWQAVLFTLLVGSLVGSVIGLIVIVVRRGGFGMEIPFGPFLAFGAMLYALDGARLIGWYLDLPSLVF